MMRAGRAVLLLLAFVGWAGGVCAAPGPHGGTLIMIGDEFALVEFILDPRAGRLSACVLDGDARTSVPLAQELLVVSAADPQADGLQVVLRGVANVLSGEHLGATSHFSGEAGWLRDRRMLDAVLEVLEVKGARLEAVAFNLPHGRERHQDMLIGVAGSALVLRDSLAAGPITATLSGEVGAVAIYGATNPGFSSVRRPDPVRDTQPLPAGLAVRMRITATDAGVSVLVRNQRLDAVGQMAELGQGPDLHVHPAWQVTRPVGDRGGVATLSFIIETDRPGLAAAPETRLELRPVRDQGATTRPDRAPPPARAAVGAGW